MPETEIELGQPTLEQAGPSVWADETLVGACYVCFGEGAPPSRCGCKDRYLHPACMLDLYEKTGKVHCTVCLQRFGNLELRPRRVPSKRVLRCGTVLVTWPFVVGFSSWRAHEWLSQPYKTDGDKVLPDIDAGRAVETILELMLVVAAFLYLIAETILYVAGTWRMVRVDVVAVV